MRHHERPRRHVSARAARALSPLFRFSYSRDAYVLRAVGNRFGPVLKVGAVPPGPTVAERPDAD